MIHLGVAVRLMREEQGWTQLMLAERAGVDKMTVSALERGRNYTRDTVQRIAAAFQTTPSGLETMLDDWAEARVAATGRQFTPDQRQLLALWAHLRPADRADALRWLERMVDLLTDPQRASGHLQTARAQVRADSAQLDRDTAQLDRETAQFQRAGGAGDTTAAPSDAADPPTAASPATTAPPPGSQTQTERKQG